MQHRRLAPVRLRLQAQHPRLARGHAAAAAGAAVEVDLGQAGSGAAGGHGNGRSLTHARAGEPDLILAVESKDYLGNAQQLDIQKKFEAFVAMDSRKMTVESGDRKVMRKFVGGMELQELKLK
jgi:hypothetical protein